MVAYELSLIMKALPKDKLVAAVKRAGNLIFSHDGFIEKIEYLGTTQMPYRMRSLSGICDKGSYFIVHFHAPHQMRQSLKDYYRRDVDIIRQRIFTKYIPIEVTCSLHEELRIPSYRPSVLKMFKEAEENLTPEDRKKKELEKYLINSYPFK